MSSASVASVSGRGVLVRIGILGAARIAPLALINPARENAEVWWPRWRHAMYRVLKPLPPNTA